jgi:hypothetical protein
MANIQSPAAIFSLGGSSLGNTMQDLLRFGDILPGDDPSYQMCKAIYTYHPLGAKLASGPVILAQSQDRGFSVPTGPETRLVEAYKEQWEALGCSQIILSVMSQARVYGIASVGLLEEGVDPGEPVDMQKLWKSTLSFNVFDPLNTAGSLVTSQDPNALDFQKHKDIVVSGKRYHRSRTRTMMNEMSIYIAWSNAAFGFTGRSVYQRALFPLKSYLQTMITNDLVSLKAGVLVAKMETPGSIIDKIMLGARKIKQALLNQANVIDRNILSIGISESIESLNLQGIDKALGSARDNIIKDIAVASGEPAKLLTEEAYVQGFGEGAEDARAIAHRIDRLRIEMAPLYKFFDEICMYRAWNEEFYKSVREELDDFGKESYKNAFYSWKNAFSAPWPSLLSEPDSEKAKVEDTKFKSVIAVVQVFAPLLDPDNRSRLFEWAMQNINQSEFLFPGSQVAFDMDAFLAFAEKQQQQQEEQAAQGAMGGGGEGQEGQEPPPKEPKAAPPFSMRDSQVRGKVRVRGGRYIGLEGITPDQQDALLNIVEGGRR